MKVSYFKLHNGYQVFRVRWNKGTVGILPAMIMAALHYIDHLCCESIEKAKQFSRSYWGFRDKLATDHNNELNKQTLGR